MWCPHCLLGWSDDSHEGAHSLGFPPLCRGDRPGVQERQTRKLVEDKVAEVGEGGEGGEE